MKKKLNKKQVDTLAKSENMRAAAIADLDISDWAFMLDAVGLKIRDMADSRPPYGQMTRERTGDLGRRFEALQVLQAKLNRIVGLYRPMVEVIKPVNFF